MFISVLQSKGQWVKNHLQYSIGALLLSRFKGMAEFRMRPLTSGRGPQLESLQGDLTPSVLFNLKVHYDPKQRQRYETIRSAFSDFFPSMTIEVVET